MENRMFAEDVNVNQLAVEFAKHTVIMEGVAKEVSHLNKMITGNGDPSNGMVVKQIEMQKDLGKLVVDFTAHCNQSKVSESKTTAGKTLDKIIPPSVRSTIWLVIIRGVMVVLGMDWLAREFVIK